jgi:hypothetical protein
LSRCRMPLGSFMENTFSSNRGFSLASAIGTLLAALGGDRNWVRIH